MNDFYNHGSYPTTGSVATSSALRAELDSVAAGFDKMPALTGNQGKVVRVNASGTMLEAAFFVTEKTSSTGSSILPAGTTAQRDASPAAGYFRFNADLGRFEGYNGASWGSVGGATGGGPDAILYENDQVMTTNYTISTGKNAMSAGPISINSGVTLTIPDGSVWTIV